MVAEASRHPGKTSKKRGAPGALVESAVAGTAAALALSSWASGWRPAPAPR